MILYTVAEYLAGICLFCAYYWLLNCFLPRSSSSTVLVCVLGSLYVFITCFSFGNPLSTITSFLGMLIQLLAAKILFSDKFPKQIALCFFFNLLDLAISLICLSGFQIFLGINKESLLVSHSPERLLFLIVSISLEFFIVFLISKMKNRSSTPIPKNQMLIILLLFISDFLAVFLVYYVLFSAENDKIKCFCLVILLIFILTSVCIFYLMQRLQAQAEAMLHNKLLKFQLSEQEKQLLSYQKNEERIRIIRHDFKHYLLQYIELLKNGESERVIKDMTLMLEERLEFKQITYTDNALFNALICYSADRCKNHNIMFSANINLSSDFYDPEIAVMILNLVDNAIEAELKIPNTLRKIHLEISTIDHELSVFIQNRIEHSVLETNPKLTSTKKDHHHHGLGLRSVQSIIKKRNGLLDIYEEAEIFCVHFMIGLLS